jgi:hypothetical protein
MFARITSGEISPDKIDEYSRTVRELILPRAQGLGGFKGGHWMLNRDGSRVLAVILFEDQRSLEASREGATRIREEARARLGSPELKVEEWEVVASAEAEEQLAA